MKDYLGEFTPEGSTVYDGFSPTDWAMKFIECHGQADGSHHKAWVLDQVARILKGTPVIVVEARWGTKDEVRHRELRMNTGEESPQYVDWVEKMLERDENGDPRYDYDNGIP